MLHSPWVSGPAMTGDTRIRMQDKFAWKACCVMGFCAQLPPTLRHVKGFIFILFDGKAERFDLDRLRKKDYGIKPV